MIGSLGTQGPLGPQGPALRSTSLGDVAALFLVPFCARSLCGPGPFVCLVPLCARSLCVPGPFVDLLPLLGLGSNDLLFYDWVPGDPGPSAAEYKFG